MLQLLFKACELDKEIAILCLVTADPDGTGIQALINDAKNAIADAGRSPDFNDDDSAAPDYNKIAQKLDRIIAGGKPDEALALAKESFDSCEDAINFYDYNEEIIEGVTEIAIVSVKALKAVDWAPARKIIWIIKTILKDDFGFSEPLEEYLGRIVGNASDWTEAAQYLAKLLSQNPIANFG